MWKIIPMQRSSERKERSGSREDSRVNLLKFDEKQVRVKDIYGNTFEGVADYFDSCYSSHEYDVDEDMVSKNLYTAGLDDPNLIIRTSGEERLSGFLLWQSSYSELYFCETLWPDLRKVDFIRAIRSYQARDRRFGV